MEKHKRKRRRKENCFKQKKKGVFKSNFCNISRSLLNFLKPGCDNLFFMFLCFNVALKTGFLFDEVFSKNLKKFSLCFFFILLRYLFREFKNHANLTNQTRRSHPLWIRRSKRKQRKTPFTLGWNDYEAWSLWIILRNYVCR